MINFSEKWELNIPWMDKNIEAKVPGTVYTALLDNGLINNPFWRDNEDSARELMTYDYSYSQIFNISSEQKESELELVCEGIDTISDIYINGDLIGSTCNMHRTYRFHINRYVTEGENSIEIVIHSSLNYIQNAEKKRPMWGVVGTIPGYQQLRKAHYMFGWDWGPALMDAGIWKNIYIEDSLSAKIDSVEIRQLHNEGCVDLIINIETSLLTPEKLSMDIILEEPDGILINSRTIEVTGKDSVNLHVNNPKLWWPNGYGSSPLYTVKAILLNGNTVEKKIGLRTITVRRDKDQWGESFGFEINGKVIFAKGANFIPEDCILGRCDKARTGYLLQSCVDANFNCIRVWGGGIYQYDWFYDLCDELGIIVWQDFMFACAVYNLTSSFEENIRAEITDTIKRLRNHACLGIWSGNNEMESAWCDWGIPQDEKLRQDYITMFERIIPELLEKYNPDTFYWPSSPSSGGGFVEPGSSDKGDAHYWDVWHGRKPFEAFEQQNFRYASEYGFQSLPSMKTINTFAAEEDLNITSSIMEKHQKSPDGNITLMNYLLMYYLNPSSFENTVYASQVLQADCLETAIMHWRNNEGRCLGSTYWQLNDCNPVISWSTIDYYGRWKAAHYVVKRAYAPVIAAAKKVYNGVDFHVISEKEDCEELDFEYRVIDSYGNEITSDKSTVITAYGCNIKAAHLDTDIFNSGQLSKYIIEYKISHNDEIIDSRTMLLVRPKQFEFVKPVYDIHFTEDDLNYYISISSNVYAKRVGIEFESIDAVLSDNYFDLLPGDIKSISIGKKAKYRLEQLQNEIIVKSVYDIR